jgi:hypothetical protein
MNVARKSWCRHPVLVLPALLASAAIIWQMVSIVQANTARQAALDIMEKNQRLLDSSGQLATALAEERAQRLRVATGEAAVPSLGPAYAATDNAVDRWNFALKRAAIPEEQKAKHATALKERATLRAHVDGAERAAPEAVRDVYGEMVQRVLLAALEAPNGPTTRGLGKSMNSIVEVFRAYETLARMRDVLILPTDRAKLAPLEQSPELVGLFFVMSFTRSPPTNLSTESRERIRAIQRTPEWEGVLRGFLEAERRSALPSADTNGADPGQIVRVMQTCRDVSQNDVDRGYKRLAEWRREGRTELLRFLGGLMAMLVALGTLVGVTIMMIRRTDLLDASNAILQEKNAQIVKAKEAVEERERKIIEAQRTIVEMMRAMHQGLLTVDETLAIAPEYSARLPEILGTGDLAGRRVDEVLFEGCTMSPDVRATAVSAIGFAFGNHVALYEANEHALIRELRRKLPGGREQTLELDWSPILDEDDCVKRVMVSVRDLTESRRLQAEAEAHRTELKMIGEILALTPPVHGWLLTELGAIDRSLRGLITDKVERESYPESLRRLMGYLHTAKGSARNHGWSLLRDAAHNAETAVKSSQTVPTVSRFPAPIRDNVSAVSEVIHEYARIGTEKLGRTRDSRLDSAAKGRILALLEQCARARDVDAVRGHLKAIREELEPSGVTIGALCEPMIAQTQRHAVELGKATPVVELCDESIRLPEATALAVSCALTHMFSNAIAHGIEAPEQRAKLGKPATATIRVRAQRQHGRVTVEFEDDGGGLDLERLRAKANRAELAKAASEKLAELVFEPALSTADTITPLAGRGEGLAAVRRAVRDAGGGIDVVLLDTVTATGRTRFRLRLWVPVDGPQTAVA